jgi:hypothetical protein
MLFFYLEFSSAISKKKILKQFKPRFVRKSSSCPPDPENILAMSMTKCEHYVVSL